MMRLLSVILTAFLAAVHSAGAQPAESSADAPKPPIEAFVYLEPYDVRAEFVIRVDSATSDASLDGSAQARLKQQIGSMLDAMFTLELAGEPVEVERTALEFIIYDPVTGPEIDRRTEIPRGGTFIAATYALGRDGLPDRASLSIRDLPPFASELPVRFEAMTGVDEAEGQMTIGAGTPVATWTLPALKAPAGMRDVDPVPAGGGTVPLVLAGLFAALGIVGVVVAVRRPKARVGGIVVALIGGLLAVGSFGGAAPSANDVSEPVAKRIVESLLANTYHAFAFREETQIFDTLAQSVDGPLLEELYLDIRRGLEDEEDGGPRVKVLRVAVLECDVKADGRALQARVLWASDGDVSHWGHSHRRRNQYRGDLRIEPIDGAWRITNVDILEEERI